MTVLQSSTPLHLIFGAASSETEPLQVLRSALVVRDVTFILQSVNCFFFGSHHHRSSTRLSVFAKPTFWCLLVSSDPYNPVQADLWPAEASLSSTSWWCCWCLTPRLDWPEEVSCCDPWRLICRLKNPPQCESGRRTNISSPTVLLLKSFYYVSAIKQKNTECKKAEKCWISDVKMWALLLQSATIWSLRMKNICCVLSACFSLICSNVWLQVLDEDDSWALILWFVGC